MLGKVIQIRTRTEPTPVPGLGELDIIQKEQGCSWYGVHGTVRVKKACLVPIRLFNHRKQRSPIDLISS